MGFGGLKDGNGKIIMLNRKFYTFSNGDFFHCDVSFWGGNFFKSTKKWKREELEQYWNVLLV